MSEESGSVPEEQEQSPKVLVEPAEEQPEEEVAQDQIESVETEDMRHEQDEEVVAVIVDDDDKPEQNVEPPKEEDMEVVEVKHDESVVKGQTNLADVESDTRIVPPPVVQTVKATLFNAPILPPQFPAIKARPVGPPVPADDEYLDGPSTPAGPIPKTRGPVPLMSIKVHLSKCFLC